MLLLFGASVCTAYLSAQNTGAGYSVRRQRESATSKSSTQKKETTRPRQTTTTQNRNTTRTSTTASGRNTTTTPAAQSSSTTAKKATTAAPKTTTTAPKSPGSRAAFSLPAAQGSTGSSSRTVGNTPVRNTATQSGTNSAGSVQPKARAKKEAAAKEESGPQITLRAQTQYNLQREVPASLVWKREVYRTIDLQKPENAGLADPVTPTADRMNLFTMIFKLLADGKLQAYEYTLDGNEQFDDAHRANFKDVLDRYHVYYRRKRIAATNDTVFVVENSDIPSNEVLSYFIKEQHYYDQNNSSFHTTVEALCPVLHRAGDFDLNTVKYPMFWIQVSDLTPYMNLISIPTSEYNNAATVGLDDFFAMQMYKGDIYKTNNPSGKTLAQYCPTDSALVKEQKRIETQLDGVEDALWRNQMPVDTAATDSTALATDGKAAKAEAKEKKKQSRRATTVKESKSRSSSSSGGSSAPKASVRRQRR